jgi:hypothetical protein
MVFNKKGVPMSDEQRAKLRLMRQATGRATTKYGIGGIEKRRGHQIKPVTLPPTPWDKKQLGDER